MRGLAVIAAAAAVAVGYVVALELPMLWFDPVQLAFSVGARPSTASMDFFGKALWAGAFGLLAAAACWRVRLGARGMQVSALLAALVIACCLGLEVRRLVARVPVAEEYPSAYDPVTGRLVPEPATRLAQP